MAERFFFEGKYWLQFQKSSRACLPDTRIEVHVEGRNHRTFYELDLNQEPGQDWELTKEMTIDGEGILISANKELEYKLYHRRKTPKSNEELVDELVEQYKKDMSIRNFTMGILKVMDLKQTTKK